MLVLKLSEMICSPDRNGPDDGFGTAGSKSDCQREAVWQFLKIYVNAAYRRYEKNESSDRGEIYGSEW
jgi:hypothetical protein